MAMSQQLPKLPADLFEDGFAATRPGGDRPKREDIEVCKRWIQTYAEMTIGIRRMEGSYGYKHAIEREARSGGRSHRSIPNGAFIAAAIELGYRWRRTNPKSPNAYFNMKTKAV